MEAEAWYKEEILAMLCWITILGGVLIMMGQHSHSEALFYYFRLGQSLGFIHYNGGLLVHSSLLSVSFSTLTERGSCTMYSSSSR